MLRYLSLQDIQRINRLSSVYIKIRVWLRLTWRTRIMVWLTERGVFALLRLDMDYFVAMYSYTNKLRTLRTSDPSDQWPVTCSTRVLVVAAAAAKWYLLLCLCVVVRCDQRPSDWFSLSYWWDAGNSDLLSTVSFFHLLIVSCLELSVAHAFYQSERGSVCEQVLLCCCL